MSEGLEGVCFAWALASQAVAYAVDKLPLPAGTHEAVIGRWRIVANASNLELFHKSPGYPDLELPAFEVYVEHLDARVMGLFGPRAGLIGAPHAEARLIEDLVAAMPSQALEPFREELERRKESRS